MAISCPQSAQAGSYANKSIPFNWISTATHAHVGYNTTPYKMNGTITQTCGTTPPILDDTISDNIPLGFTFNFGGTAFTSVRIMSNGRLQFNNNTECWYGSPVTQLPYMYYRNASDNLDYSMRIYGNDLDPTPQVNAPYMTACTSTATCYMSYATMGTAPNRKFVATWNNVPEWAAGGSTSGNYNLQVILNEDGTFIYQYGSDTPGPQAPLAQVGWQIDPSDYDVPKVGLPANDSAILFYIPNPIAQYHFQQSTWAAAGDVLDTSGSTPAYNGTALGGAAPTPSGHACYGALIPSNTKTSTIDAIDTGISVPSVLGGAGTIDFWYKANANWVGGGDAQLLDASIRQNQWFFVVKRNNGDLRFVITDSTGRDRVVQTGRNNISAGVWTHIAVTWNFNALAGWNQDHMRIYVNGVEAAQSAFTSYGTVSSSIGTLYLGDNRSSHTGSYGTGNSANGTLDEANIYNLEGGIGLIQRDMNYTSSCGPDHLEIRSPSGTGLTCAADTLTVVACGDATCSTTYTSGVYGTLSASGTPTVNWDGTTGGATGSGFVIPSGTDHVTKNVQVATTGTVTFGVATATPTPNNPVTCNFGNNVSANNCVFTANNAGFIFSDTSSPGNAYTIPAQISGRATGTLYLRAVQASTTNPAVCTPAIASQTTSVNMGYACNDPASCQAGNLTTVGYTSGGTPTSTAVPSGGASLNLDFDANGSAPINVRYDDVGKITLNANATITPTGGTSVALSGSSNAFVVKPDHFDLSAIQQTASPNLANPGAPDATGAKFVKAGEAFSVTVTARNALGNATPNYGQEATPESVKLTSTLVAPTGGNIPAVSGSFGAFNNGVATGTGFSWGEVGVITLTPSVADGDYLGAGNVTGPTSGNVGRFYPAKFGMTLNSVVNRSDLCPPGVGIVNCPANFTYMGERMTALFTLTAQSTGGLTTGNYITSATASQNFAKLDPTAGTNPLGLTALDTGPPRTPLNPVTLWTASGSFTSGVASVSAPLAITRAATPVGPYAAVDIGIDPADSDGVTTVYDVDTLNVTAGASNHTKVGTTQVLYGRIQMSNAYGSELLDLPVPTTAQYWNGSSYITNSMDSQSKFSVTGDLLLASCAALPPSTTVLPYCPPATAPTPASVAFINGIVSSTGQLTLKAPGSGHTGSVDLSIPSVNAANCSGVLPSQPLPVGCYLPSYTARDTFGVYGGSNKMIYMRESY